MPDSNPPQIEHFVYRVVNSTNWDAPKNRPKPTAFKQSQGRSLSVFRSDKQTPRGAIQHIIDTWIRQSNSVDHESRERALRNLHNIGDTVEKLVAGGYQVVKVPLIEFISRDFTISEVEENGHQDIVGDFDLHKRDLANLAMLVPEDECLLHKE